jgi:AhpD family alkylhydroperoxidase
MRLSPIEKPKGWKLRAAYAYSKARLGRAITPLTVVYARTPAALGFARGISAYTEKGMRLNPGLRLLLQTHVARINDCGFCLDIGKAIALRTDVDVSKFGRLDGYREDPAFSEAERAALAYVEEATRSKRVSDATFARLREHFTDEEIVEITLINAIENFYNLVNLPLEIESDGLCALVPGVKGRAAAAETA